MEYVQCKTCSVSVLKQLYRKHSLDHGISCCKGCEKQFSYDKRLIAHIENTYRCAEFYRSNMLEIPTMKPDSRKKKKDNSEQKKFTSEGIKEEQEKAVGMYLCPSCGEDLLKPNINLDEHKSGLCMKSSLGQFMEGSNDDLNHQSEEEFVNRFSKPPLNDTLSEDIHYDEDDPMSEESQMENSANGEPDHKKPRLSESYEKENLIESNSSSDKLEDEPEVTLDEGNSLKSDPKDGKKKYSLELRISTIKRIEEEGLINIKAIAADIEVKLGVVHKWWLRKDKLKLLHDLKLEKERLTLEKSLPQNSPTYSEEKRPNETKQEIIPEEHATTNSSENLLNELQQGLNETGKFLNDLESNSNSYDNNLKKFEHKRNEYVHQSPEINSYSNFSLGNNESHLKVSEAMLPLRKLKPCQMCAGCKAQECTTCKNCLDKPKFGGKNVIRQKCVLKVCDKLQEEKRRRELEKRMNLKKTPRKTGPKRQYNKKSDFGSSSMNGIFVKEEVKEIYEEHVNKDEEWKYEQIQGSYPVYAQNDGRGDDGESHPSGARDEQGMANLLDSGENAYVHDKRMENVDLYDTRMGNIDVHDERLGNVETPASNGTSNNEYEEGNRTENNIRDVDENSKFSEHVYKESVDSPEGVAEETGFGEEENGSAGKEEDPNSGGMKDSSSEELESSHRYGNPSMEEANRYGANTENFIENEQKRNNTDTFERNPFSFPGNPYSEQYGYPQAGSNEENSNPSSEVPYPSQVYQPNSFGFDNFNGIGSQQSMNINEALKGLKRKRVPGRCKACPPCLDQDCRNCKPCLDMVKFGGPGKMRKSCINRKCVGPNRKSSESLPIKSYSPESKVDKPEESRFLLSSFMSDRFPKANNLDVESPVEKFDPTLVDSRKKNESTSLGKLMNFVKNHEVAAKENDEHKSVEESEKDRTELEKALGSIRAEASNDWLNNADLFSMGAVTAEENPSKPSGNVGEETRDDSERKQDTEDKSRSENMGKIIRFPGGLEILPSRKTSEEVFFANEVTITKKVRQTESNQENCFQSNPQEANLPGTTLPASDQQFSVASRQHPSIAQPGVSITKLAQGESHHKKRSQKSKEFNINKILSKLQPVPIAGQPASTQLNITSKDLESEEAESAAKKEVQHQMNHQGYNSAKVYHLGDSMSNEDPSQGYYNQFQNTGFYPENPDSQQTQYSTQSFSSSSYPNYSSSSYLPSQANYYSSQTAVPVTIGSQEMTSRGNLQNVQEKPSGESLRLEDYINNEEARSIQDLLLNDSLNKVNSQGISPSIKVEVDEESSVSSTKPKVISFQNSISESFPTVSSAIPSTSVTVSQSTQSYTVPKLPTLETQSKLANLTSLNVQVKSSISYPVASKNLKMHEEAPKPNLPKPALTKSKVASSKSVKDLKSSGSQNIVTLFPTDMEESSDGQGVVNLTKTYTISKQQMDNFRTISRAVVKNEMSVQEAGKLSGLDEEIVKTWVDSLEDILATNQEAVEKARKYEEMKKHVGSLAAKLADLQSMVQLTAVVKKERDAVPELPSFTPLAENIPIDLSVKIPQEEQLPFTNVTDMINKMFC